MWFLFEIYDVDRHSDMHTNTDMLNARLRTHPGGEIINITYAVVTVGRQVKAFMAAAGVVTVIVVTQVNTTSILILTLVLIWTGTDTPTMVPALTTATVSTAWYVFIFHPQHYVRTLNGHCSHFPAWLGLGRNRSKNSDLIDFCADSQCSMRHRLRTHQPKYGSFQSP